MKQLECCGVSFSYEGREVLTDINFTIEEGDYCSILGENGAGKSTLLKGLLHLKKPSSGTLRYEANIKRNDIGYLPQQTEVQRDFPASVWEVVLSGSLNTMGLFPFYRRKERELAEQAMQELSITELRHHCFRDLSGGQKQRVLLARAILSGSKILILDEPVTGLDPRAQEEFYQILENLNRKGMTILMVSHDLPHAIIHAGHVLELDRVQKFFGTREEYLSKHPEFDHIFHGGLCSRSLKQAQEGAAKQDVSAREEKPLHEQGNAGEALTKLMRERRGE